MNKVIVSNGYIIATATTSFGTDTNADEIEEMLRQKKSAPDGYQYKLRADTLEWELVEAPVIEPTDDEATESDYISALQDLGVEVE